MEKVCEIVKRQLAVSEGTEVCGSTNLSDLGADSLDMVNTNNNYRCHASLLQDAANATLRSETLRENVCDDGFIKHGSGFSCVCDEGHTIQFN